jgi:hypothetical protein
MPDTIELKNDNQSSFSQVPLERCPRADFYGFRIQAWDRSDAGSNRGSMARSQRRSWSSSHPPVP